MTMDMRPVEYWKMSAKSAASLFIIKTLKNKKSDKNHAMKYIKIVNRKYNVYNNNMEKMITKHTTHTKSNLVTVRE